MQDIIFRSTGIYEIASIRPLWEELNRYHHDRATTFRPWYDTITFSDRVSWFRTLQERGALLLLDLAIDPLSRAPVGYCISTLTPERFGEIESIAVTETFRSRGIGSTLVVRSLAWMDGAGAIRKRVSVAEGNEHAWGFYRRFGFFPRMTVLEQR